LVVKVLFSEGVSSVESSESLGDGVLLGEVLEVLGSTWSERGGLVFVVDVNVNDNVDVNFDFEDDLDKASLDNLTGVSIAEDDSDLFVIDKLL
jgi:hypothetical protein